MHVYPSRPHPALRKDVQVVRTWDISPFRSRCPTTPYRNPQEMGHQGIDAHYRSLPDWRPTRWAAYWPTERPADRMGGRRDRRLTGQTANRMGSQLDGQPTG